MATLGFFQYKPLLLLTFDPEVTHPPWGSCRRPGGPGGPPPRPGAGRGPDAIRAAKDTGLRNLPFREFAANAVWLELVLIAQDLIARAQTLLLEGDLARAEPKRLRYRLLHVAGRITR